jgi:hypothetical protein
MEETPPIDDNESLDDIELEQRVNTKKNCTFSFI